VKSTRSTRASPTTERRLRLLSYNMQVGLHTRHYGDYLTRAWRHLLPGPGMRRRLDGIVELVRPYDFVALQEADAGSLRTLWRNQLEYLAARAGFEHFGVSVTRNLRPVARHCLGYLSRFRPERVSKFGLPSRVPGRGGLVVTLGDDVGGLVVLITHLSLMAGARSRQLDFLSGLVPRWRPVVLVGDLNSEPDALRRHPQLLESGLRLQEQVPATFPSWRPRRRLDHVLVSPGIRVHELVALQPAHSDHLPLSVELGIPLRQDRRA
jgi:endonuclease/exonuclease/phosphatase family metal-dependent hydrolase